MKLITYDGAELKVTDEALLIRPIRQLLEQDKTKSKENFYRQMSYLWFMCDPRSTYMYMTDETERAHAIKEQEGFDIDWEPSPLLVQAMEQYKKHVVTTSSLLLEDLRIGINNLRVFFRTVNLQDTDSKGKPLYQVSSITSAIKQAIELSKMLGEAEQELAKDYEQEQEVRGSQTPAAYEDI